MRRLNKPFSMLVVSLAATAACQAAQTADLQRLPALDPRSDWPAPLQARSCTLHHTYGAACRPDKSTTYDSPPPCSYHSGHSHVTPNPLQRNRSRPLVPSKEAVDVEVDIVRTAAATLGALPEIQVRFGTASLLAAMGRHHGLTVEELRVQAIHLDALEKPARLGLQYVAEQVAVVLPVATLTYERLTLVGGLPPSTPVTKVVVVVRGSGIDTAGGGPLVPQSRHDWQAPQLRCVFQQTGKFVPAR